MINLTKVYVFEAKDDQERLHTFAKILVNGLYVSKFLDRKTCLFIPNKILLPKVEVAQILTKGRKKNFIFIEPMYVLAVPNPNYSAEDMADGQPEYFIRPKAREFINVLSSKWEIALYSSRKAEQLTSLVNTLDPLKTHIRYVLDRRHCCITQQKRCIKDLSLIQGLNEDSTIMIDYKPQNVAFCINQSLLVLHWNGSDKDNELVPGLLDYLNKLADQEAPAQSNKSKQSYADYLSNMYKRVEL